MKEQQNKEIKLFSQKSQGGRAVSATKKTSQIVKVSGKGENKAAAFSSALSNVSKQILKESTDVLLRIEPKDVDILSATEKNYTERFLFFFFPRKRTTYEVELNVEVEISMIDMAEVPFRQVDAQDPNGVSVPFTTKKI
ncbi:hypothetical protein A5888_001822 [Enterococcus sp. 9E7_DIV0242]|uniref:Cytoplasmic protein n=1 Tax=Candidatus Enterococcus clewellii TaxID=1834193 RepID=A0A242K3E4_9ENTE|nr:hypothetical protein A5888_002995 [Enterococcus sp. 9E7_DIV0242]